VHFNGWDARVDLHCIDTTAVLVESVNHWGNWVFDLGPEVAPILHDIRSRVIQHLSAHWSIDSFPSGLSATSVTTGTAAEIQ
jgi:hypothetical protein